MKKIIATFVVFILVFTMTIPAFAAENHTASTRSAQNSFMVSSANPTDSFTLERTVYENNTEVKFTLDRQGPCADTDVITLRFHNTSTNRNYSVAVSANVVGVQPRRTIGVTIPAGNYTVSIAHTPCYIYSLSGIFYN